MKKLLLVAFIASSLFGCTSAPIDDTKQGEGSRAKLAETNGQLVYEVCVKMHADSLGAQLLPIVCKTIADDCKTSMDGDGCKRKLRPLDEKLKASGSSMLYEAAYAGRTDIARTMIGMGSDPNETVTTGWTPLMIAAAEGHLEVVTTLIKAGANVNARNNVGRTSLMFASSYGFTPIVKELLTHGADPNIVPNDQAGWTALMVASRAGHVATVQTLLDGSAKVAIRDKNGDTALALAEAQGHSEVVRLLKEAGSMK